MPELTDHLIQAGNPVMGTSRFLTLRLPPAWNLAPGVSRPEVDASHERRHVKWVAAGSFWYVVYDGERRWALEFACHVRPFLGKPIKPGAEPASVAGHPGQVYWQTKRRGLLHKRHDVTYMIVEYDCPQSERRLKLEFSGWCPEEGFREVLAALAHLRCH